MVESFLDVEFFGRGGRALATVERAPMDGLGRGCFTIAALFNCWLSAATLFLAIVPHEIAQLKASSYLWDKVADLAEA